jgi:hypothetical protein
MSDRPRFTLHIDQNKYLAEGGQKVHAILTVESDGAVGHVAEETEAAQVIIIDVSPSMHGVKIAEARKAAQAAIDTLRDGVLFAIVAGNDDAHLIYPATPTMVRASEYSRQAAKTVIELLRPSGAGTSIGRWLSMAARLLEACPRGVRHAILLTDGQDNEGDIAFTEALRRCAGRFTCDSLGIGEDWEPAQLRMVAHALLGTFDFVRDTSRLADHFRSLTRAAIPQAATLTSVKQMYPTELDLTGKRSAVNAQTGDYPTGSWGTEEREYQLCVEVPAGTIGQEIRAAWVKLVLPDTGEVVASGNVLAQWTDDLMLSTRISARVAHYTGQAELNQVIQEGLSARARGDLGTATARLALALRLAGESGRQETARLLDKMVEVDPGTGTARLRQGVARADEIALDTGTDRTTRMGTYAGGTETTNLTVSGQIYGVASSRVSGVASGRVSGGEGDDATTTKS